MGSSTGDIVAFTRLDGSFRLDESFPRRKRRTLLRGIGWSLEVAEEHGRPFGILDEAPDADRPDVAPAIVIYEFASRRARAEWIGRRLDAYDAHGEWPTAAVAPADQLEAARRWVASELRR